jgi:CRP-like cAMP-binding protein
MKQLLRQAISQTIAIDDDEWAAFEPHIFTRKIKKRDLLLAEKQVCDEICFVVDGSFRQFYIVDGEEKTTFFFFEQQFACDYDSFLTRRPCDHYIEAMEDTTVLYFSREVLLRLYKLYPKYETFGRLIAENVYLCIKERLHHFLLEKPEARYKKFMSSYEAEKIMQRAPQHYVASYLGITPVSLSRIRARVARERDVKSVI